MQQLLHPAPWLLFLLSIFLSTAASIVFFHRNEKSGFTIWLAGLALTFLLAIEALSQIA